MDRSRKRFPLETKWRADRDVIWFCKVFPKKKLWTWAVCEEQQLETNRYRLVEDVMVSKGRSDLIHCKVIQKKKHWKGDNLVGAPGSGIGSSVSSKLRGVYPTKQGLSLKREWRDRERRRRKIDTQLPCQLCSQLQLAKRKWEWENPWELLRVFGVIGGSSWWEQFVEERLEVVQGMWRLPSQPAAAGVC